MKKYRGKDSGIDEDGIERILPELRGTVDVPYPSGGGRETYYEPYTPLVGPIGNVTPIVKARKKKAPKPTGPITDEVLAETAARKRRYDTFIDYMIEFNGDRVQSLARTYGVLENAIRDDLAKYMNDVLLGMTTSSVSNLLEDAGLGKASRIALLKKHAYDGTDPKVSLVAIKIATDLDGDKHDKGTSYEQYVRLIKGRNR